MFTSWRGTALGILGGLALLVGQAINLLDSDPATVFSLDQVLAAFAMMGLGAVVRDNAVSSEQAGAKP